MEKAKVGPPQPLDCRSPAASTSATLQIPACPWGEGGGCTNGVCCCCTVTVPLVICDKLVHTEGHQANGSILNLGEDANEG